MMGSIRLSLVMVILDSDGDSFTTMHYPDLDGNTGLDCVRFS